jgi:hypothetical protein
MSFAHPRTDWSVLSALLRLAQREGWTPAFGNGRVRLVHRRAAQGVVVLPAALLGHAREAGWRVSRQPDGFDLRHPAVRHRVEVKLAV